MDDLWCDSAHCEGFQILRMSGFAEDADARYDAALVSARGQSFEEKALDLSPPPWAG